MFSGCIGDSDGSIRDGLSGISELLHELGEVDSSRHDCVVIGAKLSTGSKINSCCGSIGEVQNSLVIGIVGVADTFSRSEIL